MAIVLRVMAGRDLIGRDGRTLHTVVAQPKRFALLAYLVIDRPFRTHARDELLALFWPEHREDNARNALSQALSFLRRALGEGAVVARGSGEVGIDRAVFTCDALDLDEAAVRGDHATTLACYHRDLLEGFHVDDAPQFERWLEGERAYLRGRAVASARALVTQRSDAGDFRGALAAALRGAELAPLDEALATQTMLLYDRLGQRADALQAYDRFSARAASELHIEPSREFAALASRLRVASVIAPTVPIGAGNQPTRAPLATGWRTSAIWTAAAVVAGVALSTLVRTGRSAEAGHVAPVRFALALDDSVRLRTELSGVTAAISPDGSQLAYLGGNGDKRLYIRALNDLVPRALEGTADASNPVFSPDGKWLAFVRAGSLKRVAVAGGPVVTLGEPVVRFAWSDDNVIVFTRAREVRRNNPEGGLWRMSATGGAAVPLTRLDNAHNEGLHTWPSFLPGGSAVLFEIRTGGVETAELAVVSLTDGEVTRLRIRGSNARYVPTGHIVFGRLGGSVFAVPFDTRRRVITGPVAPVLENVTVKSGGATEIGVARNGTLVYVPAEKARQLVEVDRRGQERPLRQQSADYSGPRYSPDGSRLALHIGSSRQTNIAVYDIARGTQRQLTTDGQSDAPSWAPDGRRVAWHVRDSVFERVVWQAWDARSAPTTLVARTRGGTFSPTGGFFIALRDELGENGFGVDWVALDSSRHRSRLTEATALQPRISPDGRWLAYSLGQTQVREVFVQRISGAGAGYQVSVGGGTEPVWSTTGEELFYRGNGKILSARVRTTPEFAVIRRDTLFDDIFFSTPNNNTSADYDVAPDGKHFIFVKPSGRAVAPIVVLGWFDELRARVALGQEK